MQNPIRGFLHGGAAIATLIGLVFLLVRAWGSPAAITGSLIFGIAKTKNKITDYAEKPEQYNAINRIFAK